MDDLLSLVERHTQLNRVASTKGGEYAGACPLCGGEDRFRVWPDHPDGGGQWWCRQCGRGGDLIAYRVERGDLTPREASRLRKNGENGRPEARRARNRRKQRKKAPMPALVRSPTGAPPEAWREQARRFCDYCQNRLFEADNEGLDHLRARGLADDTIRDWGLGWYDGSYGKRRDAGKWGLEGKAVYLARGVVIPWTVDGEVYHVKTRLFETWKGKDTPKYIGISGGNPTIYGLDHLTDKPAVVICEGELDAILLAQEAGDLVDVVAIGAKGAKVDLKGLTRLLGASRWLVALDTDAGKEAEAWAEYSARVARIRPLAGNDLTDMHNEGGDLRAWISYHLGSGPQQGTLDLETQAIEGPEAAATDLETEAAVLLDAGLSLKNVARWAEIAEALGWPCWEIPGRERATWAEWAREIVHDRTA